KPGTLDPRYCNKPGPASRISQMFDETVNPCHARSIHFPWPCHNPELCSKSRSNSALQNSSVSWLNILLQNCIYPLLQSSASYPYLPEGIRNDLSKKLSPRSAGKAPIPSQ